MANDEIRLGLKIESEGERRATRDLDKIRKAQEDLRNAFRSGDKDAKAFTKELADLEKEARRVEKALDALAEPRAIDVATDRFDATSQGVSLAGDLESNARTVGGAIGAFGGAGAERAIGTAAEIPALIEALPRLKAAAAGLPATISSAASALGTSSAGLIGGLGIAAVAIGAVAIAFKRFSDDAKKQADQLNAVIDARRDVGRDVASGLGSDEAKARLEEINAVRAAEAELLEKLKAQYDGNISSQNALYETALKLTPQEQALADQIKESEAAVQGFNAEERALNQALEDGRIAANDARNAELELAQARTQGVLQEASQDGKLAETKARLAGATKEQIDGELKSLGVRKASLEAELTALKGSADQSDEVKKRIEQLTDSLSFLAEEETSLKSLRSSAKTDKQVEHEKELAKAREESTEANKEAIKSERERAGAIRDGSDRSSRGKGGFSTQTLSLGGFLRLGRKPEDLEKQKEDQNKRLEIERDFAKKELELRKQMSEQRFDLELNRFREAEDSIRDYNRSRADALEEGNFLQLREISKQERRTAQDRAIEFKRGFDDITREANNARRELQAESAQAMRELNAVVGSGLRTVVQQFQAAFNQLSLTGGRRRGGFGDQLARAPRGG